MALRIVSSITTLAMSILLASQPGSLNALARMELVKSFAISHPDAVKSAQVNIYRMERLSSQTLSKRHEIPEPIKPTLIDMTPSECTSRVCYPGSYEAPEKTDCDIIIAAQLYNSTGSLSVQPGYMAVVSAGTCAVAFQNPWIAGTNYTMQYNWASLGKIAQDIVSPCFQPDNQSIGGACEISHYLKYNFKNLVISLQRYIPTCPRSS